MITRRVDHQTDTRHDTPIDKTEREFFFQSSVKCPTFFPAPKPHKVIATSFENLSIRPREQRVRDNERGGCPLCGQFISPLKSSRRFQQYEIHTMAFDCSGIMNQDSIPCIVSPGADNVVQNTGTITARGDWM